MLKRHILGYAPSIIIPALASFGSVYAFTRLLQPEDYGYYALVINTMTLLNGVFFTWQQVALTRMLPEAARSGREDRFQSTIMKSFLVIVLALLFLAWPLSHVIASSSVRTVVWLALLMTAFRSLLNNNLAVHRSRLQVRRYNLIECGQSVSGLFLSIFLVVFFSPSLEAVIIGLVAGMVLMTLIDMPMLIRSVRVPFDRAVFREIVRFGAPLMLSYGLGFIISRSDSYLVDYYLGPVQVGIYAAGYTLMDRLMTFPFTAVSNASFPLIIKKLEEEGGEAARKQAMQSCEVMLALAVPACAGLILVNRTLAEVMIGPALREGAMTVMPWIALSGLLNGLATHYFQHAFHFSKKTGPLFWALQPAALLNLGLNFYLISHFGILGAAYSTVAAYALLLLLTIFIGRRVFPLPFPFWAAVKILLSSLIMMALVSVGRFPSNIWGLLTMVALGAGGYTVAVTTFNVLGLRDYLIQILRKSQTDR